MRKAPAAIPRYVEFHYSRIATLFAVIFLGTATLWTGRLVLLCLLADHALFYVGGAILLVVSIPLLVPFWISVLHACWYREAVVIFDEHGVTDVRQKESFIAWEDIGRISLGVGETYSFLCFQFREARTTRQHLGFFYVLIMIVQRIRFLADWNINLRLIHCRRMEALRLAQGFHRRSISERIAEANRALIVNPRPRS